MGKVLHSEGDRIPPPTLAAAAFWGVGDSILGVHKWWRCCTVEGDRIPPATKAAAACWGVGDSILGVQKWGR